MARVVVAMSGGVDSSVAAYILKEEGNEVIGFSMQLFNRRKDSGESQRCCSIDDLYDARAVADSLGIPFYVINLEETFQREVIGYFASEYLAGRTPNPCIICNERLKFHHLMRKAKEVGADYMATGHYARKISREGSERLLKGIDSGKDQSYFLFSLNQEQLKSILFPLGDLKKGDVRGIAKRAGLRIAEKSESQEICFVSDDDYGAFLKRYYPENTTSNGNFVDLEGKVLGRHKGIHNYTIGQRRGLGIAMGEPLYVVRIEPKSGTVVLGKSGDLFRDSFSIGRVSSIGGESIHSIEDLTVKVRYRSEEVACRVKPLEKRNECLVELLKPVKSVTPGQAAVFYKSDEVLGGGWIL